jgi:hypothetical protein
LGILSGIVCLSLLAGPQGAAAADEAVEQTKAKLQAVRKQLEELRQQEQALLKQLEQATREAAQRKESYIKAEVKGILRHEGVYFPSLPSTPGGQVVQLYRSAPSFSNQC